MKSEASLQKVWSRRRGPPAPLPLRRTAAAGYKFPHCGLRRIRRAGQFPGPTAQWSRSGHFGTSRCQDGKAERGSLIDGRSRAPHGRARAAGFCQTIPARAARRGGSARADRTVSRTYWQIDRCRTDFRAAACNHLMPPAEWPMAGCLAAEPWLFPHMPICRDGRPARRFGSSAAIGLRCTDRSGINRQCVAAGRPDRMPQSCPASLCRRHIRSDLVGACS